MLTYLPAGVMPDLSALRNGTVNNDDGHGFAIVANDRLIVRKSMFAEELINAFDRLRTKHPDGPALFHSRLGTGGQYSRYNCHPFYLGDDRQTVIAHNGIFGQVKVPLTEDRCDTRIAAEDIIPRHFNAALTAIDRAALTAWAGKWNKLVILTVNPAYEDNAFLINEAGGAWDNDVWYSNWDYLPHRSHVSGYTDLGKCAYCGNDEVDAVWGVCLYCDRCADCGMDWQSDCQCWTPSERREITADLTDEEIGASAAYDAWAARREQDWEAIVRKYSHVVAD